MRNIFELFVMLTLAVGLWACDNGKTNAHNAMERSTAVLVSGMHAVASAPYLTKNPNGEVVLCWTEALPGKENAVLKFVQYDNERKKFGDAVTVGSSMDTHAHPESMNKVAFREDGTIVAVFAKKHPTEENPYAGSIFYTQSFDHGKTWTDARYLHTDTLPTYGRSFFDLATLPDGEVGAIWLDGRFGDADNGSALFFAKTNGTRGFGEDKQIGGSTCECCRTEIYVDPTGKVHVAYRDIIHDNIRDIVYQWSGNSGETFSKAKRISIDNWKVAGCPHTGPSLTHNEAGLHAVWFTAGGAPGVYQSTSFNNGQSFSPRKKISAKGRHPQLTALPNGKLAIVWEASGQNGKGRTAIHTSEGMKMHGASPVSKVVLQVRDENRIIKTITVTPPQVNATYPVLQSVEREKILVAWVQGDAKGSGIYYQIIDLENVE